MSLNPITDEEVKAIACTFYGKLRPEWPEEIRQIVTEFIKLRDGDNEEG